MRVAIIGNSGSGKSTLAKQLAEPQGAPVLDLDTVAWEHGKIAVARDPSTAAGDVRSFCESHDKWVVEGCYASLIEAALEYQPRLIFLDPGVEQCRANCVSRPWEPHKYASKEEQDARLEFLLVWVADYYEREGDMSHSSHDALFDAYHGPKEHMQ
jgi:adenylate kinase family enzyme